MPVHKFSARLATQSLSVFAVIGKATWIGIGASVIQGINIGTGVMVGAGVAVVRDIDSRVTVAGVPARQISPPLPPSRT
ncbi:MAG: hypothetical protein ACOYLR_12325 [Chlorobium sp.]